MSISAPLRNWCKQAPSGFHIPHSVTLFERLRREIDRLRRENKDLRRKVAEDRKELEKNAVLLKNLEKELADRDKKIDDLEHQLAGRKKNSSNSSKPPSSDGPAADRRVHPQRKKSGRKQSGQKGHAGSHRALVPTEQVSKVIRVLPPDCRHCGYEFPDNGRGLPTKGEPHRHQDTELPEIHPYITEYQFWKVLCPDCGQVTWAPVPRGIRNHFGPKLTAFLAYLTVVCRMPRRKMEEALETVLSEGHLDCADGEVRTLARLFFNYTGRLFAFVRYPGVEPTNNVSECALCNAVQWPKTSFGNRSQNGELATARLLTAARTRMM